MNVFIGSYTEMITEDFGGSGEGIYSLSLDSQNGQLHLLHVQKEINPSYLAIDPDRNILYCIKEVIASKSPSVSAYRIHEDQSLTFINSKEVIGGLPCHILFHEKHIYIACYASGNILEYPTNNDGLLLSCSSNYQHVGGNENSLRQEAPHAHQICVHPNGKELYVPDLGIDKVKAYSLGTTKFSANPELDFSLPSQGGPRHMVFNDTGDLAYVINELTAAVSVVRRKAGRYEHIKSYSSIPESYRNTPSASAIRLHPNNKHLYAGNRGSETIALFEIDNSHLYEKKIFKISGKTIREFNISPDGKWLLVACQDSNDLITYSIDNKGSLTEAFRTDQVISPVCIVFH